MKQLLIWLGLLSLAFAGRRLAGLLPHEPRLIVRNDCRQAADGLVIESNCGPIRVPRVEAYQFESVALPPRPGCRYLFGGEDLAPYFEQARSEKADVIIVFYADGVRVTLSHDD